VKIHAIVCLIFVGLAGCGKVHTPGAVPPPLPESVTPCDIASDQKWQSTGVEVNPADIVTIVADGMWTPHKEMCNANGMHSPVLRYSPLWLIFYLPNPMPSQPINMLIGRIGKGPLFAVGTSRVFVADRSGELLLRPNDWWLPNSTGRVRAGIHVERPARSQP